MNYGHPVLPSQRVSYLIREVFTQKSQINFYMVVSKDRTNWDLTYQMYTSDTWVSHAVVVTVETVNNLWTELVEVMRGCWVM